MAIAIITAHGAQSGQTVDVQMGFSNGTLNNSDFGDLESLVEQCEINWSTMNAAFVNDLTFSEFSGRNVPDQAGQTLFTHAVGAAYTGALANDPCPIFVVAKVALTTGLQGRSFRGRFGFPGLNETNTSTTNGNQLTAGTITDLNTRVPLYFTNVEGSVVGGWEHAVISQRANGIPRPFAIGTTVTGYATQSELGTRLSRLR